MKKKIDSFQADSYIIREDLTFYQLLKQDQLDKADSAMPFLRFNLEQDKDKDRNYTKTGQRTRTKDRNYTKIEQRTRIK